MTDEALPNRGDSELSAGSYQGSHEDTAEAVALLPTSEQLEIAESILDRLKPSDRQNIGSMIHSRGQLAGIILAALGIFWWLSVLNLDVNSDYNQYTSLISGLSFVTVSWFLPILIFFGSLLNAIGRHRGQPGPSMFAGILFLLCLFFTAEPVVRSLAEGGGLSIGLWQTLRLLILGSGVFFAANLFIEAFLLDWVKKLEEAYFGIEISPLEEQEVKVESISEQDEAEDNPLP
jgi:hypothetical protein